MRIKNGKVFVGKTFVDADIAFDSVITAIGKLEGEADFDAEALQTIADSGVKVIEYTDAELEAFKDATASVYTDYANIAGQGNY